MHHVVLERWSRGSSAIHRRDPRAKMIALVVFLVVIATAHQSLVAEIAGLLVLLCVTLYSARLPLLAALSRAAFVLPFTLVFAIISWLSGDTARGAALLLKSYVSALAVILVVGTTPLPSLLSGLGKFHLPRFLLMVTQFLYRYLFVISEEAQNMIRAAACRGGKKKGFTFRAAAGGLAVLFARSYSRAEDIHRAMLARGFTGEIQTLSGLHFHAADLWFAVIGSMAPVALRAAVDYVR